MSTNRETATAFVQGRTAYAGHLSATVWGLYSYSTKIANHTTTKRGQDVILLTVRDYSATTIRHKSHTRTAAYRDGCYMFEVPNIEAHTESDHRANFQYLREEAEAALEAIEHTRKESTREMAEKVWQRAHNTANKYYNLFVLPYDTERANQE